MPLKSDTLKKSWKTGAFKRTYWNNDIIVEETFYKKGKIYSYEEYKPMLDNTTETFTVVPPGEPSKTFIQQKIKCGKSIKWYENGNKQCEGNIKDRKRDGKWVFWNEEGKIEKTELYKVGRVVSKQ